jgi:hypothetical protein
MSHVGRVSSSMLALVALVSCKGKALVSESATSSSQGATPGFDCATLDGATPAPDGATSAFAGASSYGSFFEEPTPPSTLLPAGSTQVDFSVSTSQSASCGWSLGQDRPYTSMTPFSSGQGSAQHRTTLTGLDPRTQIVNDIYVRCDADPTEALHLRYRALPNARPSFPRTGNLWGTHLLLQSGGLEHCQRVDLFLGAGFQPEEILQLRGMNPNVLVLDSISAIEHTDSQGSLPDYYYLRDTHGARIEVWPGRYRLNLTLPEVAQYQAHLAYQRMLDSGLAFDGIFFDNFQTSVSWLDQDVWGNSVAIDADRDGVKDDPAWLDAQWKRGVCAEIHAWRQLMPWAYTSGHVSARPPPPEVGALFNGDSIGIFTARVRDGTRGFNDLWAAYQDWWKVGRAPVITMVEGSPPDLLAYGYGYQPTTNMPASTLEFARTYFPYMRFALGLTLMNDGYFAYELGDAGHGLDWWYDELDFDLGQPLGPATRVDLGTTNLADGITNGYFEIGTGLDGWSGWTKPGTGAAALFAPDTSQKAGGARSARVEVTAAGQGAIGNVELLQQDRRLDQGVVYDLKFWGRADADHVVNVSLARQVSPWTNYGLYRSFSVGPDWKEYTATFEASATAADVQLTFSMGGSTGTVWIDGVRLVQHPADVFRRDFEHGAVFLNGTRDRQVLSVGAGLWRLQGSQAPRYQYLVDDGDPAFRSTGGWRAAAHDSGLFQASGPWFHNWGTGCHELPAASGTGDVAEWTLEVRADDTYTIDAWWPAAPQASGWSPQVLFEVRSAGAVVARATFDQTRDGDQWHRIGSAALSRTAGATVRVTNLAAGSAIADALLVQSAARYNNGAATGSIELDPMDAVVLRRTAP